MGMNIRRAVKEDCPRLMELVRELAVYEKAPNEVTVSLEHFEESGFGKILFGGHLLPIRKMAYKDLHFIISVILPGKDRLCIWKIFWLLRMQEVKGLANYFLTS